MTDTDLSPRGMTFQLRSIIDATISPLDFKHPVLAAQFADALLSMSRTLDLSDGTLYQYQQAIVKLLRELPGACPRGVGFSSPGEDLIDAFHEWELALGGQYSAASNMPHRYGLRIRRLVKVHAANGHGMNEQLIQWARGGVLHRGGEDTPLDEFTNAERLAIRDACRARIRSLEERLEVGRQLLSDGDDPRHSSWLRTSDIVWGVRYLGRSPAPSIENELSKACRDGVLDALDPGFMDDRASTHGGSARVTNRLLSYLYPSSEDLVAFRTLLQLETGAAPEEWTAVKLDDISHDTEAIHVRLHKARAHRVRTIRCAATGNGASGGWRAGDLLTRLLAATEIARTEANERGTTAANALFISVKRTAHYALEVRTETFDRRPFATLLSSIAPAISEPFDARRLRKTVKSVRAAVLRSADVAADDHSVAVYQRHYAQSTTVHVLAGTAVNAAQQMVFDQIQGPVFINATARTVAQHAHGPLAEAAALESKSVGADAAMGVAHCTSPYDSPHSPAGRLCEHRPAMCFACPNAIVFADHLPRVLLYREVLRGHEKEMPPAQFAAVHGQQLRNVEHILSAFSPEERGEAQREAMAAGAAIHVPLSQRGVHL